MADLQYALAPDYGKPPAGMNAAQRRAHRVDHGLCPQCGKEAAPYYLCFDHRQLNAMSRMLGRMASRGIVQKAGRGLWKADKSNGAKVADFTWGKTIFEMDENDASLKPRLGRRPIDLDETMFSIFRDAGKPLTMEEIYHAWGRLRSKRKTALAVDMAAIIQAERRREARRQKLLNSPAQHPQERGL